MRRWRKVSPLRHMVAPDGTFWWIRVLRRLSGSRGVYIPQEVLDSLGWQVGQPLQVWVKGETVCIRALKVAFEVDEREPVPPDSWSRTSRISKFDGLEEVKQ